MATIIGSAAENDFCRDLRKTHIARAQEADCEHSRYVEIEFICRIR
jgi:hypothetical protein